jgi:hypothetical protein
MKKYKKIMEEVEIACKPFWRTSLCYLTSVQYIEVPKEYYKIIKKGIEKILMHPITKDWVRYWGALIIPKNIKKINVVGWK